MMRRPMIAGRIWAGRLSVTASITADQDFEFISDVVQEAVYFNFLDEHPGHGDSIDLTVGVCDAPIDEGGVVVLIFPAVISVFDPDLQVEDALDLVAGLVREAVDRWYEKPERFRVSLTNRDGNPEGMT